MKYRLTPGVLRAPLQDDEVLLNPATGQYHMLNWTGRVVLAEIERSGNIEPAAAKLASSADAQEHVVRADVAAFVDALRERGLIQPA